MQGKLPALIEKHLFPVTVIVLYMTVFAYVVAEEADHQLNEPSLHLHVSWVCSGLGHTQTVTHIGSQSTGFIVWKPCRNWCLQVL